ncbi:MAG: DUF748 domain-containing protein, partial [Gammaproteobacteria bacterium]
HLRIEEPAVRVARTPDGSYDVADIVERLSDGKTDEPEAKGPPRFSVANVELTGGRVELDDRTLNVRHAATDIGLRIPFVSSLPVDQDIEVEPGLELRLDGAPVHLKGRMLPFAAERTGEIDLSVEALDLTRWLPHLPEALPVKVVSAVLSSELTASFFAPRSGPAKLLVHGKGALGGVEVRQPDGRRLVEFAALEAEGVDYEPLASRLAVGKLTLRRPAVVVERRAGEAVFFEPVVKARQRNAQETAQAKAPPAATSTGRAEGRESFAWSIGAVEVEQGKVSFDDKAFEPRPLQVDLQNLAIDVTGLSSAQQASAQVKLSAKADHGESLAANGQVALSPLAATGEASLGAVRVADWAWLAGPQLALQVEGGSLALSTRFQAGPVDDAPPLRWRLSDGKLHVES